MLPVAYKEGLDRNLECNFRLGIHTNPKLQITVEPFFYCDEAGSNFNLLATDKSGTTKKIILKEYSPVDGFEQTYYLKEVKWIKNSFVIRFRNKQELLVDFDATLDWLLSLAVKLSNND